MTQPPEYLTSAEVCTTLHIDRSTLSRWVAADRIEPAMKLKGIRGALLFDPAEVARVKSDLTSGATK